jgi:hypothetical protein
MKVEFQTGLAATSYYYEAGEVAEIEQGEAEKLIRAGVVIPVREKKIETAAVRTRR